MLSVGGLGGKYAVGKIAKIMTECDERISRIQKDVYNASCDIEATKDITAVCESNSTCFGDNLKKLSKKTVTVGSRSLTKSLGSKNIQDPRLRKLYETLENLERVGRLEWLEVFMYISSYMRILRPLERGKWDEPKKFVQRQTLILDGPYPGISNDLITAANISPQEMSSNKIFRKPSTDLLPSKRSSMINVSNMEQNNLIDDHREFASTTRPRCPRSAPKYDSKVLNCDCREAVYRSASRSENGRKQLTEKFVTRPKYVRKYDYCFE